MSSGIRAILPRVFEETLWQSKVHLAAVAIFRQVFFPVAIGKIGFLGEFMHNARDWTANQRRCWPRSRAMGDAQELADRSTGRAVDGSVL